MLRARLEEATQGGALKLDVKIFDLRDVELAVAQVIDERPVLMVTFNTQQVTVPRDIKTGQPVNAREVRFSPSRSPARQGAAARLTPPTPCAGDRGAPTA